jgi:hypothetical protein
VADGEEETYGAEISRAVQAGASLGDLVATTVRHRDHAGLSRDEAKEALTLVHLALRDEYDVDALLELMDFVWGWCQPRHDLWK